LAIRLIAGFEIPFELLNRLFLTVVVLFGDEEVVACFDGISFYKTSAIRVFFFCSFSFQETSE